MPLLNKMWMELRKFGFKEVFLHIRYVLEQNEMDLTKMYIERERYFSNLNLEQLENELSVLYSQVMKRKLDFINPETFTEKIQYLKIYENTMQKTELADKYAVRRWIRDKVGEDYLVPLLGVWNSYDEIDFNKLPNSFCLKMNHGSGMNCVIKDKNNIDYAKLKADFKAWVIRPFEAIGLEMHYKKIKKRIIAEEYIEEISGGLYDYKFHCFNGKPIFIQCIGERNLKNHTGYQKNYDMDWKELDWTFEDYPMFPYDVPKPKHLDEMIYIATKLSEGFKYVRVDLYDLENKVLFGEMTFTPGNGIYPYKGTWTEMKDRELGKLIYL